MATRTTICCLALLAAAPLRAQEAPPPLAGRTAAQWAAHLAAAPGPGGVELAAHGRNSLPMIRHLLDHELTPVANAAALACERLGADAAPLYDVLTARLHAAPSWWQQAHAAAALGAIGRDDPAVRATLLRTLVTTAVPYLRTATAQAFLRLDPHPGTTILEALTRDEIRLRDNVLRTLLRHTDAIAPDLLVALETDDRTARLAGDLLAHFGWQAVAELERRGHLALARRALLEGPLLRVAGAEVATATWAREPIAVASLPALDWQCGNADGALFASYHAEENAHGLRVVRAMLHTDMPAPRRITFETATLSRATAAILVRQLLALPCIDVQRPGQAWSLATDEEFHCAVRVVAHDRSLLELAFTGSVGGSNLQERFGPEAALRILDEAMATVPWAEHTPTAAERKALDGAWDDSAASHWALERARELALLLARQ